uniref:Uncharacterized protein n=1 Tax=Anas zonorhyncha TaxID=75864 RepID=A0A8B9U4Y9_9AVES
YPPSPPVARTPPPFSFQPREGQNLCPPRLSPLPQHHSHSPGLRGRSGAPPAPSLPDLPHSGTCSRPLPAAPKASSAP